MSLRSLEGDTLNSNATRTVTAVDTAAADNATFTDTHKVKVLGAGALYVHAGHNNASGTASGHFCFYDKQDNLIGFGTLLTLAATAVQATLKNSSGTEATRNLAAAQIEVPTGAFYARFYVTVLTTTTSLDLYLAHDDGFTR